MDRGRKRVTASRWFVRATMSLGVVLILGLIDLLGLGLGVEFDALKLRPLPINRHSAREEPKVPAGAKQPPWPQAETAVRGVTT